MAKYRFKSDREGLVPSLAGAILQPDQVFDPAEFGVPDWIPEPNPHPHFELVSGSKPKPTAQE